MYTQIIAVIFNIILNYFLIIQFGVFGAAWATVLTQFLSLYLLNVLFKNGKKVFITQSSVFNFMHLKKDYQTIKKIIKEN